MSARSAAVTMLLAIGAGSAAQNTTFITWNIRYDNPDDGRDRWELRRETVAEEVMRYRPQVVGLQEVLAHQAEYLDAQWPGYARYGVGREDGAAKGEFSPIYFDTTTHALLDGQTIWLSPTPMEPSKGWDASCERIATLVVLLDKRSGDSLWVANTHWDHEGDTARLNSARMLMAMMNELIGAGRHAILMGDFNCTLDSEPLSLVAKTLRDPAPMPSKTLGTYNGFDGDPRDPPRIDYLWHSPRNWEVLRYDVPHPQANGRQASDHFPVVVGLRAH